MQAVSPCKRSNTTLSEATHARTIADVSWRYFARHLAPPQSENHNAAVGAGRPGPNETPQRAQTLKRPMRELDGRREPFDRDTQSGFKNCRGAGSLRTSVAAKHFTTHVRARPWAKDQAATDEAHAKMHFRHRERNRSRLQTIGPGNEDGRFPTDRNSGEAATPALQLGAKLISRKELPANMHGHTSCNMFVCLNLRGEYRVTEGVI